MKFTASKWPVTITYEIADDWFDGIEKENLNEVPDLGDGLQDAIDESAQLFMKAKGMILAKQEADRKQKGE